MRTPLTKVIAVLEGREIFRAVLPPGEYVIGRATDAAIRLRAENVSRRHAKLTLNYRDWLIEDVGSSNGTRVGGRRVVETTLVFPHQEVLLGDVELRLELEPAQASDRSLDPHAAALLRFLPPGICRDTNFRVLGLIGIGGMGAVLEAEDPATRRRVAMKVLLGTGSAEVARFVAEGQITAQLDHPNILPIYQLGLNAQDKPFYTMKLVRGVSLEKALAELQEGDAEILARLSLTELLRVFDQICAGIAFAHAKRIVHRDLKPDNIMLGRNGEVWVTDWGLAKPLLRRAGESTGLVTSVAINSVRHTDPSAVASSSGLAIGSPQFMSPEQAAGVETVDERADVYSLGAILYQMLALKPPVQEASVMETLEAVAQGKLVPLADRLAAWRPPHLAGNSAVDQIAELATWALAMEPERRPASVKQFQARVRALCD